MGLIGLMGCAPGIQTLENNISNNGLNFIQNGQIIPRNKSGEWSKVQLASKSFQIEVSHIDPRVCLSPTKNENLMVYLNMGSWKEFSSCLSVFKTFVMDDNSNYLFVDEKSNHNLTERRGLKAVGNKYVFTVNKFNIETKDVPLEEYTGTLYSIVWIDKNQNKFVDQGEAEKVILTFN